jgi:hypothetical protein
VEEEAELGDEETVGWRKWEQDRNGGGESAEMGRSGMHRRTEEDIQRRSDSEAPRKGKPRPRDEEGVSGAR